MIIDSLSVELNDGSLVEVFTDDRYGENQIMIRIEKLSSEGEVVERAELTPTEFAQLIFD